MTLPFPQLQLTEALVDVAVAARAVDRNERADRVRAERLCKGDFLFRSGPRNCHVRCAEPIDKLSGKELDQHLAIVLGCRNDLRERRPSPGLHAKKAAAEGCTCLSAQLRRILTAEAEGAGDGRFAWHCRHVEHEGVGGIQGDRA